MAVRNFAADNSELRAPVIAASNLTGALTVAALVKRNATGTWQVITSNVDSAASYRTYLGFAGSGVVTDALVWGDPTSVTTVYGQTAITSTTTWYLVAYSKPAGVASGRIHFLPLGGAWAHQTPTGVPPGNPATQAGGSIRIGETQDVDDFNGRIALVAVWNSNLSDAQIEALATNLRTADWTGHAVPPSGVWQLNQAAATDDVPDLMGNHATITGTITSTTDTNGIAGTTIVTTDDPPGWTFSGGTTRQGASWQSSYIVKARSSRSWASSYVTRGRGQTSWQSSYTTKARSSAQWASSYAVIARLTTSWASSYTTATRASSSWASSYTTRARGAVSWQSSYVTRARATQAWTSSYVTHARLSATWQSSYTVNVTGSTRVGASWASSWTTRQRGAVSWASSYGVTGRMSQAWASTWTTRTRAAASWQTSYAVRSRGAQSWMSSYTVRARGVVLWRSSYIVGSLIVRGSISTSDRPAATITASDGTRGTLTISDRPAATVEATHG